MQSDAMVRAVAEVERSTAEARSVVDLCRSVQRVVDAVVPSDRWCGFAVDPATLFATNGFHDEGIPQELLPRLLEIEYGEEDVALVPALARSAVGVTTMHEATQGDPARSPRWRDVLVPAGLAHELRAVFRDADTVWGAMALFRSADVADFTTEEVEYFRRIGPIVARGFRSVVARQHLDYGDDAREAGILVLAGDALEIVTATPAARSWLAELDDCQQIGQLPTSVVGAARGARRRRTRGSVAARVRTRSGRWLTITAECTDSSPTSDVGVVVQPSRPAEVAQIVGAAFGLTAREREVVLLVASGQTNQEIARHLGLSRYTVVDHLKNVFAKLGVASRGELTSRLYQDYYLGRVGLPVGVDRWFLGP